MVEDWSWSTSLILEDEACWIDLFDGLWFGCMKFEIKLNSD